MQFCQVNIFLPYSVVSAHIKIGAAYTWVWPHAYLHASDERECRMPRDQKGPRQGRTMVLHRQTRKLRLSLCPRDTGFLWEAGNHLNECRSPEESLEADAAYQLVTTHKGR